MAKKKLFKSKSNFSLKRLHQSGNYGNIYERDYTTIVNSLENIGGQIPIFNSPTFKLSVGSGINRQKKYNYGNWLQNPNNCTDNPNEWTLNCLPDYEPKSNKIILKPNSRRLTDFACFESSYNLIKSALKNIIKNFPAEIYVTEEKLSDSGILELGSIPTGSILVNYKDCLIIDNPFQIDILQKTSSNEKYVSKLRFLFESEFDYDIIKGNGEVLISGEDLKKWNEENPDLYRSFWNVEAVEDTGCLENGDLIATVTFKGLDEDNIYIEGLKIYCFYYEGSILFLTPSGYENYRLRPNQKRIDEYYKNLSDFEKLLLNRETNFTATFDTFIENEETGWCIVERKYKFPIGKGGWNLSIDGISFTKYANELSELALGYDELYTNALWKYMVHESIGNMDLTAIHLSTDEDIDNTKLKQVLSITAKQFDEIKKYIDNIKSTNSISYDQNKNIPDYFLSDKLELAGWETKQILNDVSETVITDSMYEGRNIGFDKNDANNELLRRLFLNSKGILSKKGTKQAIEDLMSLFGFHSLDWLIKYHKNKAEDYLQRAFVLIEYVYVTDGYAFNVDDISSNVSRLNQLKDTFNSENLEESNGYINDYEGLPVAEVTYDGITRLVPWFDKEEKYDSDIYFQKNGGWARNDGDNKTGIGIYTHSISKINYITTLDELYNLTYYLLNTDNIYYVANEGKYLKLKDIEKYQTSEGWEEVTKEELNILESIVETNKGNNPHTGEYDGGISYIESFGELFKHSQFNNVREEEVDDRFDYGFNLSKQADSSKCLFFGESHIQENVNPLRVDRIKPYNLFTGENETYDEVSSLSVINSKEFHIIFSEEQRTFVENDVLPYLKQIIPSTAIFSYSFEKITLDSNKEAFEARSSKVICDGELCPIYGVV